MSSDRQSTAVTVDLTVFTVRDNTLQILLVERGYEPFLGQWALPGGYLEEGEDLDRAAARELAEETGLDLDRTHLEQLGAYGAPDRDPRGRVVTVAYVAFAPTPPTPVAGDETRSAAWKPVQPILTGRMRLAFDHQQIVTDAVERTRSKLEYTTLATAFCPEPFTITELRRVYEIIWGQSIDQGNFSRKILNAGVLISTGEKAARPTGRPATLYHRGPTTTLHPAIPRTTTETSS